MRLLVFQARHFWWKPFSRTLEEAEEDPREQRVEEVLVAFLHAESGDQAPDQRDRVARHVRKHLKWLANKRGLRNVVLHSFTHLGGDNADPDFARQFLGELQTRLEETDYQVWTTPFGWFCEWEVRVYGESLAKVWKQV